MNALQASLIREVFAGLVDLDVSLRCKRQLVLLYLLMPTLAKALQLIDTCRIRRAGRGFHIDSQIVHLAAWHCTCHLEPASDITHLPSANTELRYDTVIAADSAVAADPVASALSPAARAKYSSPCPHLLAVYIVNLLHPDLKSIYIY
ncbi:hypothetical protein CANCADRAFT_541 [Tortispora caseinolytica NRRL Y-17796]|uniref:Uncharacterized protein n=1 Tax=Tortispora caseinolytica NRRL Y-17796 TaxID=767744 RepID=A0A1E4TJN2_9ASCO|nr:hypothetical protein CANCADRAFT_541 [Tortispora caseinolytica NRRL Y-17796]